MLASASGQEGERFLDLLDRFPKGRNVAELGVGTNDRARLTGVTLEDEKIYGTIHIAFGSNDAFGGTVAAGVHLDAVVLEPKLYLDERLVVGQGRVRDAYAYDPQRTVSAALGHFRLKMIGNR
jgi:leucyl aminopeptidase (aminopeptidase T)